MCFKEQNNYFIIYNYTSYLIVIIFDFLSIFYFLQYFFTFCIVMIEYRVYNRINRKSQSTCCILTPYNRGIVI
jgi:hypothetical protein